MALWIATVATGVPYFRGSTWARWDSGLYMDIAANGYSLVPCGAGYAPGTWCGNAGWFPGYPSLMAVLNHLGVALTTAGMILSALFAFGTLLVLWVGLLDRSATRESYLALAFAALLPGMVYYHAVFPLAMATFFIVLALAFLRRSRWGLAGAAGAVAAVTYPTVVILTPLVAAWVLWRQWRRPWWPCRIGAAAAASLPIAGGFFLVLAVQRVQTGAWDAYFKVQDKYHHDLVFPLSAWVDAARPAFEGAKGYAAMPAVQAALVGVLVIVATIGAVVLRRRLDPLDWLALGATLALWLFPLTQEEVHLYRSDALLIPLVLVVRRLPWPLQVAAVGSAALLSVGMVEAFLTNALV